MSTEQQTIRVLDHATPAIEGEVFVQRSRTTARLEGARLARPVTYRAMHWINGAAESIGTAGDGFYPARATEDEAILDARQYASILAFAEETSHHIEYRHVEPSVLFADMPGELVWHERGFVYPGNPSVIVRLAPRAS